MRSEAERKIFGAAGDIPIHERAEPDLMHDSLTGDGFRQHTDHDSQHGCTSVEAFHLLKLLLMDGTGRGILEPLVTGLLLIHGAVADV